jgi:hypothetical protein
MDDSKIVEIYSAANSIEAYAMTNALKAAGIKARVANEFLQMGVGMLPLSHPLTPRVWVLKEDEVRARELLKHWHVDEKRVPKSMHSE